jgi:isocitrate dehydrogenase
MSDGDRVNLLGLERGGLEPELVDFAHKLEASVIETIEAGTMTGDLAMISQPKVEKSVTLEAFVDAIAERLRRKVEAGVAAG